MHLGKIVDCKTQNNALEADLEKVAQENCRQNYIRQGFKRADCCEQKPLQNPHADFNVVAQAIFGISKQSFEIIRADSHRRWIDGKATVPVMIALKIPSYDHLTVDYHGHCPEEMIYEWRVIQPENLDASLLEKVEKVVERTLVLELAKAKNPSICQLV